MEELKAALIALIDERLTELGLLVEEPAKPAKKGKAGKKAVAIEDEEVTEDTLKEKITALVNSKGKDAAKALLKKAKVEKLSELDEKHYEKFNALLDAELAEDGEDLFGD